MTKLALNAISKEKHSPRRHEEHEEKQKRLTFFWFPIQLGNRETEAPAPRDWKLELGSEYKHRNP